MLQLIEVPLLARLHTTRVDAAFAHNNACGSVTVSHMFLRWLFFGVSFGESSERLSLGSMLFVRTKVRALARVDSSRRGCWRSAAAGT
jgi:hypothetical protein